jgi:NAD-dependent dihydropyrimidine dehydrogenase PreA subunit
MGQGGRGNRRSGRAERGPATAGVIPAEQPAGSLSSEHDALRAQMRAIDEQLRALHDRLNRTAVDNSGRHLVAAIDTDKCIGCGLCVHVCPADAIAVIGAASVDTTKCTACRQCVDECPQGAISMRDL